MLIHITYLQGLVYIPHTKSLDRYHYMQKIYLTVIILNLILEDQLRECLKVWSSKSSNWIPAAGSIPASTWNIWSRKMAVLIGSSATIRSTVDDISKSATADGVEPWVQEAEPWLVVGETDGVEDRNDTSKERGRGTAG